MRALPPDEVSAENLASLEDRVAIKLGKPQSYGTQIACVDHKPRLQNADGTDLGAVDRNRRRIGLSPLADYLRSLEQYCAHSD